MKTVMPARDVIHKWANQTQPSARTPSGNVFFRDSMIFSYREPWPMARLHKEGVVLNANRYSVTTGKHQGWVSQATLHIKHRCWVPRKYVTDDGYNSDCRAALLNEIEEVIKKLSTARTDAEYGLLSYKVDNLNKYHAIMAYREAYPIYNVDGLIGHYLNLSPIKVVEFMTPLLEKWEKHDNRIRYARRTREARRDDMYKRMAEERSKTQAERIEAFLSGKPVYSNDLPFMARLRGEDMVETSHGATVPLAEAVRMAKLYQRQAVVIGEKCGGYMVRGLDETRFTIGCHTFARTEIDRFITVLEEKGLMV